MLRIFRRREDEERRRELEDYLARETEENIARGMAPEEARRVAHVKLGSTRRIREEIYEMNGIGFLETLWHDVRYGMRVLGRSKGFAFAAILTLALGIGVNTSVFSLIYALAIRPLPLKDASSLVTIYQDFRGQRQRGVEGSPYYLSFPEYVNYRDGSNVFTGLAAYAEATLSLGGANPESIRGLLASCNYFEVLGADFSAGRGFGPSDCSAAGAGNVAVVGHNFWQRNLSGDPSAIGKTITLDNQVFTVIGVLAPSFPGTELQVPDVWIPIVMAPQIMPNDFGSREWLALPNVSWLHVMSHLKPRISRRRAEAELTVLARQMDANYPGRQTVVSVNFGAFVNNPEARTVGVWFALGFFVVAGLILLMTCANVTNLLLARAAARQQEVGIRLALGASRNRLIRQLLTESLLLAGLGGLAGLIVALWLPPVLARVLPEIPTSGLPLELTPNFAILFYAVLASAVAAVISGLAPAMQATKLDLATTLKSEGAASGASRSHSRLRNFLVTAQVAGCTLLLVAASLLARGLHRAENLNPGFITKNVFVVSFDLAQKRYSAARASAFDGEMRDRLAALPGIAGVTTSGVLPCVTGYLTGVTIPGDKSEQTSTLVLANIVSPDYFVTMGVPILRGHAFTEQETQTAGTAPAVISMAMARRYWPGEEPLGKEFATGKSQMYQVTGIAPDLQNLHLGQVDGPFFYGAADASHLTDVDAKIFVRTTGNSASISAIPGIVRQLDLSVMVTTQAYDQILRNQLTPARTGAVLVSVLGVLAMLLAVVGVTGVVSYAASQRVREIGIRVALGAQPRDILALLLGQGAKLVAIGLLVGLVFAVGAAVLLSATDMLFGLSPLDPWSFAGTTTILAAVALISISVPARRAMRVDPMVALRYE